MGIIILPQDFHFRTSENEDDIGTHQNSELCLLVIDLYLLNKCI